jgi:hypothetical protein
VTNAPDHCAIAATALAHSLALATRYRANLEPLMNRKSFPTVMDPRSTVIRPARARQTTMRRLAASLVILVLARFHAEVHD